MEYSLLRDDPFIFLWLLVWSILGIILFFKLWRMTDDVRAIRNMMAEDRAKAAKPAEAAAPSGQQSRFAIGALVISKADGLQWRVKAVDGNTITCKSTRGEQTFTKEELEEFPQR